MEIKVKCPTAFILKINPTTGCMPCPLYWV
jgi:hypothetical protein